VAREKKTAKACRHAQLNSEKKPWNANVLFLTREMRREEGASKPEGGRATIRLRENPLLLAAFIPTGDGKTSSAVGAQPMGKKGGGGGRGCHPGCAPRTQTTKDLGRRHPLDGEKKRKKKKKKGS